MFSGTLLSLTSCLSTLCLFIWLFIIAYALTCELRGLTIHFVSFHHVTALRSPWKLLQRKPVRCGFGVFLELNCLLTSKHWIYAVLLPSYLYLNQGLICQTFYKCLILSTNKTRLLNTQHTLLPRVVVWYEANTMDEWVLPGLQALRGSFGTAFLKVPRVASCKASSTVLEYGDWTSDFSLFPNEKSKFRSMLHTCHSRSCKTKLFKRL